jgi:lysine 6-dehydrogenase
MNLLVVGAGNMARAVCHDLVQQPDVAEVRVCDTDRARLKELVAVVRSPKLKPFSADAADRRQMTRLMQGCSAAVSCVPYFYNLDLTRRAIATKTHFCDLGGNNDVVDRQMSLDRRARRAGVAVVPDCGLAPGMVSILAADGVSRLDRVEAVRLRVGGLPRHPKPPLNYALVFSPNGLINEYVEKCLVLRNGKVALVEPLADVEEIRFPKPFGTFEAFNTSGGSSRLPLTYAGRVKALDYKTIRYPGHCAQMRLLFELGLTSLKPVRVDGQEFVPRRFLIQRLEAVLPWEKDDVVLVRVEVTGKAKSEVKGQKPKVKGQHGGRVTITYDLVDCADRKTGLTAMMRTTGFPAAVVALMMARGQVAGTGVMAGEVAVNPSLFITELRRRGIRLRTRVA